MIDLVLTRDTVAPLVVRVIDELGVQQDVAVYVLRALVEDRVGEQFGDVCVISIGEANSCNVPGVLAWLNGITPAQWRAAILAELIAQVTQGGYTLRRMHGGALVWGSGRWLHYDLRTGQFRGSGRWIPQAVYDAVESYCGAPPQKDGET